MAPLGRRAVFSRRLGISLPRGPSPERSEALSREFRAVFGETHRLLMTSTIDTGSLVKTGLVQGVPTTMINLSEKPVTRAIFANAKGVAAQEYALLHDNLSLKYDPIKSVGSSDDVPLLFSDETQKAHTLHAVSLIHYTSAMSQHEHAAEFARYEYAKYMHLKKAHGSWRGIVLLSRAYVEAASDRYGAGVDPSRLTADMGLDDIDRKILAASRDMIDDAHEQRQSGPSIDARRTTRALDAALGRQTRIFMGD